MNGFILADGHVINLTHLTQNVYIVEGIDSESWHELSQVTRDVLVSAAESRPELQYRPSRILDSRLSLSEAELAEAMQLVTRWQAAYLTATGPSLEAGDLFECIRIVPQLIRFYREHSK